MAQNVRTGFLEKKGTMMWGKKFVSFDADTLELVVSDKESSPNPIFAQHLKMIMVNAEDNTVLNFVGGAKGDSISLRAPSFSVAGSWYDTVYSAMEDKKVARPRHGFLPRKDPRFGVQFMKKLPEEYITRFAKIEHSVVYWFAEVKNLTRSGGFSSKPSLEDRIAFLSDKCLYVTQRDGTPTMCCKVHEAEGCFTNLSLISKGECKTNPFVVFKFKQFDLHLEAASHLSSLLKAVAAIFTHHHGYKTLDMKESDSPMDGAVKLNLNPDAKMAMVVPTTKVQLKKALDQFAAKHGIEFEADTDYHAKDSGDKKSGAQDMGIRAAKKDASADASAKPEAAGASSGEPATTVKARTQSKKPEDRELPMTDPLACFLANCDLGKYYFGLVDQGVDLDCLEVMEADDLANFGMKDPGVVNLLRYKLQKEELLQEAKDQAEEVQKGAKWVKSATVDEDAPALPSVSPPQPASPSGGASASPSAAKKTISFESDSDDDLLAGSGSKPAGSPANSLAMSKTIAFDDSDSDDLDLGALMKPKAKPGMKISLDSDSDDDFMPAKKPAAKAPISLDDDDDI